MAVTEDHGSQNWHFTPQETRTRRIFTAQYDLDIDPVYSLDLPVIGDRWNDTTWQHLQVVDIVIDRGAMSGANNTKVVVTYSTRGGRLDQQQKPNNLASWEESLEFSAEELPATGFLHSDGSTSTWTKEWIADGHLPGTEPPLSIIKPRQELNVVAYSDRFLYEAVRDIVGKVNADPQFLNTYSTLRQGGLSGIGEAPSFLTTDIPVVQKGNQAVDTGNWLLNNSRITRAGDKSWRYDFQWLRAQDGWKDSSGLNGWNHPYGVAASVNMYKSTTFFVDNGLLLTMAGDVSTQEANSV